MDLRSSLVGYDQPGAAVASANAQLGYKFQLAASRTVIRVHVTPLRFTPEMIFD
jgi:hypothetical protein